MHFHYTTFTPTLCWILQSLSLLPLYTTQRPHPPISLVHYEDWSHRDWNKRFCLCKLYYSLLVTAFSKLWGTTGFRENCEVQGEDSLDHNDTRFRRDRISNHSSINICMWHCKIMSPLSFLFLCHYLHFIRTRTFMTLIKLEQGLIPQKNQFKLIWSVRCCSKWWIRRNLLLLENILHRFTNTQHLFT